MTQASIFSTLICFLLPLPFTFAAENAGDEWIDLLKLVDTQKDGIAGEWEKSDAGLEVEAQQGARLVLPWKPTAEYDFEVTFTRKTGTNSIALIFLAGKGQASLDIDGWGQHLAGIQNIAGSTIRENKTRVTDMQLENGKTYTATLKVRQAGVQALLDGKDLTSYAGNGADLSLLDLWKLPDRNSIGIGAWDSATIFEAIRVRPLGESSPNPTAKPTGKRPRESAADELVELSDEFDDTGTLNNWRRVFQDEKSGADQLQRFDIDRSKKGWMIMVPHASTWYQDYRGVLAHKLVAGDFVVTTHVQVSNRAGNGPPRSTFSLAGIMLRSPRDVTPQTWQPGGENYIFLSLGAARDAGRFAFEVKTTLASRSDLEINETDSGEAIIQAARIGEHFILLKKTEGGSWNVHRRYRRQDLPAELQVGFTVYTDYVSASRLTPQQHNTQVLRGGNPDLRAAFDYLRFRRPEVPQELRGRAFSDPQAVSDAELLEFLGDAALK